MSIINVALHVISLHQLVCKTLHKDFDWHKTIKYSYVFLQDDTRDIFLDGVVARNRALNGDIVVVKVLPREQWKVN